MNRIESQFNNQSSIENQIDFEKKWNRKWTRCIYFKTNGYWIGKKIAEESLKEEFAVEITSIDFQFAVTDSLTYEDLTEVIVYITESEPGEGAMNTVEDVVIEWDHEEEEHAEESFQEIENSLRELWEIEDKEITVYWEGEGFWKIN